MKLQSVNSKVIQLYDYHIIKPDSIYDERDTETGLIRLNTAHYREEKELDRYERKLLSGVIVECPVGYTETNFMPIDPGFPNPRIYVGHDTIQQNINQGRTDWDNGKYNPSLKEAIEFETMADWGALIDAKVGEPVFFHPSLTESENMDATGNYLASVNQIFFTIRDGKPAMQAGHVLVKPHWDESLTSESSLIVKLESEYKVLEGTVAFVRNDAEIKQYDEVLFEVDSDWVYEFEGEKYFLMREENVLMKKT